MLEGIVTEWRDRGFGFIEFSENGARICRAYVHSSHCEGVRTSLAVGQVVHAVVVPDDRNPGKFTAQKVKKGPLGQSGVVVEWNAAEGFGYVSLDEGGKAYLHRSLLGAGAALGEGFEIGRQIRVTLKPDEKNPGKWAVDTIRDDKPDIDEATVRAAAGIGMTGVADESVLEEGAGVLTDWNSDRQYGFVMILDGPAMERRAYIHTEVLPEAHRPPTVGLHLRVLTKPDPRNPGKIAVAKVLSTGGVAAAPPGVKPLAITELARTSATPILDALAAGHHPAAISGMGGQQYGGKGKGRTDASRYRTSLCKTFVATGYCRYELQCQFAHGIEELRSKAVTPGLQQLGMPGQQPQAAAGSPTPVAVTQPAAVEPEVAFKATLCKTWQTTGSCKYAATCLFAHGEAELRGAGSPTTRPAWMDGAAGPDPKRPKTENASG